MADNQWVEDILLQAAGQFRYLPRAGPSGHRGYWPDFEQDIKELSTNHQSPVIDVDLIDSVLTMMSAAPLEVRDKLIVWARVRNGKLRGWRRVGKKCGYSHEYCRNRYQSALAALADWMRSNGSR